MIVLAVAFPDAFFLDPEDFLRLAARALYNAVGPAERDHERFAVLQIGEVENGFLKSLWRFHVMIMRLSAWSVK